MSPQTIDLDETVPAQILPYANAVAFTQQPTNREERWNAAGMHFFGSHFSWLSRPAGVPEHAVAFKWSNGLWFWGWN